MDSNLSDFAREADSMLRSLAHIADSTVAPHLKSKLRLNESQRTLLSTRIRRLRAEQRLVHAVYDLLGEEALTIISNARSFHAMWATLKKATEDEHLALSIFLQETLGDDVFGEIS